MKFLPSKNGKAVFFTVLVGVPIATCGFVLFGAFNRRDDFKFLNGRLPFASGVMYGEGYFEYRIYCLRLNYAKVRAIAGSDLKARGYRLGDRTPTFEVWNRSKYDGVELIPGPSRTRREALGGKRSNQPDWVTVIVSNPIEESWVAHLRYAVEPTDY